MNPKDKIRILMLLFSLIFVFYLFNILPSVVSWGPINNHRNVSVRTTVNITDAMPEILAIVCNSNLNVTLTAGGRQNVTCNIMIEDFNGGITLNGTNGSGVNFSIAYYYLNLSSDPEDNNTHYTNNSCTVIANSTIGFRINWSCGFYFLYYANNGTWTVNVTVHDRYNNKSFNVSRLQNFTVLPLFALNLTDTIDFGDMFVGETSTNSAQANITKFVNMWINVSVYGYGAENFTLYSAYAMICTVRNLTLNTERYSTNASLPWASMTPISFTPTVIPNLSLPQQQNDSLQERNFTYWKLFVDPSSNPFGQCNGTVIFSAQS